jgi:transposase-like protein
LVREIEALGYLAVGRRYGVSDNAIRKWRRAYEAERARDAALDDAPDSRPAPADHASTRAATAGVRSGGGEPGDGLIPTSL